MPCRVLALVALLLAALAAAWVVESAASYVSLQREGASIAIDRDRVRKFCYGQYRRESEIAACLRAATRGPEPSLLESDD